jgi:hypothetical protein
VIIRSVTRGAYLALMVIGLSSSATELGGVSVW